MKNKDLFKNIALMLFTFFIIFAILEGGARLIADEPPIHQPGLYVPSENKIISYELNKSYEGIYSGAYTKINSQGLRDKEYSSEKPSNTYRIVVLGDSFTFGDGIALEETYTKQLENILNEKLNDKNYEVINFGVDGYNTIQEAEVLKEKAIKFDPDLIIIGYLPNDAEISGQNKLDNTQEENEIKKSAYFKFMNFLNKYSRFVQYVRAKVLNLNLYHKGYISYFSEIYAEDSIEWQKNMESIKKIADIGKENNIPVLLIIIPIPAKFNNYHLGDIHEKVKIESINNDLYVLDTLAYFQNQELNEITVSMYNPHLNKKGNEIIANAIYNEIKNMFI